MSKKLLTCFAAVSILGVVILLGWPSRLTQAPIDEDANEPTGKMTSGAKVAGQERGPRQALRLPAPRPPASPSDKLAMQHEAAADRRAFVDEALRQPELGGYFFAAKTITECMAWVANGKNNSQWLANRVSAVPQSNPSKDAIIEALKRMHEPCVGFDASPLPYSSLRNHAAAAAVDPIHTGVNALKAVLDGTNTDQPLSILLNRAAQSGNAYLVYESLNLLGNSNSQNHVVTVDGNALHPAYWDAFAIALPAAACQLGVECTFRAWGLTNQCARGRCYSDVYEYARAALDDAQYQQFLRFHDITISSLANRDFGRFGIFRKPK
jgi:hypothetical protein